MNNSVHSFSAHDKRLKLEITIGVSVDEEGANGSMLSGSDSKLSELFGGGLEAFET